MEPTPEFAHMERGVDHELREALTLVRGWLQAALNYRRTLDERELEAMIAAALSGANRVAFILDVLDGDSEESLTPPAERTAADLLNISDSVLSAPIKRE